MDPSVDYNPELKKNSPFKYWVFIVIILLLLLPFFVWSQRKKPQVHVMLSGLDIAKKSGSFLQQALLPDGDLVPLYACDQQENTCTPSSATYISGPSQFDGFAARAFIDLYRQTNDTIYKDDASKILSFILTKCDTDVNYCTNSIPGLYAWYKLTGDTKYRDAISKGADNLLGVQTLARDVVMQKGEFFFMLYDATGDQRAKQRLDDVAQQLAKGATLNGPNLSKILYQEGSTKIYLHQILSSEWLIAAYQATHNPLYLQSVQNFFDKATIDSHIADLKKALGLDQSTLEYLLNVSDISDGAQKQKYLSTASDLAQIAVSTLWDSTENKLYNGDFGFITARKQNPDTKSVIFNSFRVRQFLRLKERQFHMP